MDNPEMNTNPNYTPITCPNCGSREIAFVTEYHKCIVARIICAILTVLFFIIFFMNLQDVLKGITPSDGTKVITILSAFLSVCMLIGIFITESKTHVQAICKNCGNLWLLN